MELSKKTTILLSPEQHEQLTKIALERGCSMGSLVREACEKQYGLVNADERIAAVAALKELHLPVSSVKQMKRESVPKAGDLLP